jgi:hypothetical protein
MTVPILRPPVSNEARGRLRPLLAALEAKAARIASAVARLPPGLKNEALLKGQVGSARAISKIVDAIPAAPDWREPTMALWRFLKPVPSLPSADPNEPPRPGVVVMAVIAKRRGRPIRCESFGVAFTAHALGRLLDRSGFQADPVTAMLQAHDALCQLPTEAGAALFDLDRAELPAAGGAFLSLPGRFGQAEAPIAVCRTWVAGDMLLGTQNITMARWRDLLDAESGA